MYIVYPYNLLYIIVLRTTLNVPILKLLLYNFVTVKMFEFIFMYRNHNNFMTAVSYSKNVSRIIPVYCNVDMVHNIEVSVQGKISHIHLV